MLEGGCGDKSWRKASLKQSQIVMHFANLENQWNSAGEGY